MAFEIIQEFKLFKSAPLDFKQVCADEAARLALPYIYKGLVTKQTDTGQLYRYIGVPPSNLVTDWELQITVYNGTTVPDPALGVIGDIYFNETDRGFYRKTAVATWTLIYTTEGAAILTGNVAPTTEGQDGDLYIQDNGDVYLKGPVTPGDWTLQFNIAGADGVSELYATTSATSIDLGAAVFPFAITTDDLGLSYTAGQSVIIASAANPDTDYITATVDSYDAGTGVMTLASGTLFGTGTHTDWEVNLTGSPGKQGKAFIHTEADIELNDAKIATVEGGTWTPINPWSASVQNDTRPNKFATPGIGGDMGAHSIAYDGTSWYDNGRWRGQNGTNGNDGLDGEDGAPGANGILPFSASTLSGAVTLSGTTLMLRQYTSTGNGSLTLTSFNAPGSIIVVNAVNAHNITINATSIKYKGGADVTSIALTGGSLGPHSVSLLCLGNGLFSIMGEVIGAQPNFRAFAATTTPVTATTESAIVSTWTSGTKSVSKAVNQGREFKYLVLASVFLQGDNFPVARIRLQRSVNGGSWDDLKQIDVRLSVAPNATWDVRQFTLHTVDNTLPSSWSSLSYRLFITKLSGGLLQRDGDADFTIAPCFFAD